MKEQFQQPINSPAERVTENLSSIEKSENIQTLPEVTEISRDSSEITASKEKDTQRINELRKELGLPEKSLEPKKSSDVLLNAKQEALSVSIRSEDLSPEGKLLVSPGGAESLLSEEHWKLVRTESFKKWFGGSNVVDENGEPALVYHTTDADMATFDSFSKEQTTKETHVGAGHYFTSTDASNQYGKNRLSVFLNAKLKDADYLDILSMQKSTEESVKKQGYSGLLYSYDSKEKYIEEQKKNFRRKHAPRSVTDKIFFALNKINTHLLHARTEEPDEALYALKRDMRSLRTSKKTAKSNFEEIVVFDADQIMIVNKEEKYEDRLVG